MPRVEIESVSSESNKWVMIYYLHKDDGSEPNHVKMVIPRDCLEWRAAEYDIDPNDIDTLIDIIFCEQFLTAEHFQAPNGLFNAPTIEDARKEHIRKIAEIKLHYRIKTRGKSSPFGYIRRNAAYSNKALAIKGATVALERDSQGSEKVSRQVRSTLKNLVAGFERDVQELKKREHENGQA